MDASLVALVVRGTPRERERDPTDRSVGRGVDGGG